MELVKGYMKPYAVEAVPHAKCVEDLYAVTADGRVFCCMAIPCPNPHFDLKGRVWHECFELSAETVAKELEFIGNYAPTMVPRPTHR